MGGRLLLTTLLCVQLLVSPVMGRVLWVAATAPGGTTEFLASSAVALPSTVGVSVHEGKLGHAAAPGDDQLSAERHRPFDRSVAGAEVMVGGLATAVLAAVFCYIRVTRRRSQDSPEKL